ncbi:uncharacterized protein LOC134289890 [Aedes albopictus]|uniref:Secreted protein n=1 Tax=Aedes albopictus TaxID=7160 RepID=A0ABM1ZGJ5_AEDAL|nr:uncharacterized protein LOC109399241 [Aedes albopictus]
MSDEKIRPTKCPLAATKHRSSSRGELQPAQNNCVAAAEMTFLHGGLQHSGRCGSSFGPGGTFHNWKFIVLDRKGAGIRGGVRCYVVVPERRSTHCSGRQMETPRAEVLKDCG